MFYTILGDIKDELNVTSATSTVEHHSQKLLKGESSGESLSPANEIVVRPNDFAVISVPAIKGAPKNYIGKVIEGNAQLGFLVSFLKKSYDKFFFPETADLSWVNSNEIVEVLKFPVKNKKDQFMLTELKDKPYKVW